MEQVPYTFVSVNRCNNEAKDHTAIRTVIRGYSIIESGFRFTVKPDSDSVGKSNGLLIALTT